MKGIIKVRHEHEITIVFHHDEQLEAVELAGKYCASGFEVRRMFVPCIDCKRQEGYLELIKVDSVKHERKK